MREILKSIAISLFPTGLRKWTKRGGSPIFLFHRVLPQGDTCYDPEMATSIEMFEAFLVWAKSRFSVLSVDELLRRRDEAGGSPDPACAITFDDGWRDNFTHALPLLRKHRVTATIYLSLGFIGTERQFWQERLWNCLDQPTNGSSPVNGVRSVCRSFPWSDHMASREPSFADLIGLLMSRSTREAEAFVAQVEAQSANGSHSGNRSFLNWGEIDIMREAGIGFGSHTVNHTLLPLASRSESFDEIAASRRGLEQKLGRQVSGFSYPWGRTTEFAVQQVKDAGYRYAMTTRVRCVRREDDAFLLPRMVMSDNVLRPRFRESCAQRADFYLAVAPLRNGNGAGLRQQWETPSK